MQQQFQAVATVMEEQKTEGGRGLAVGDAPPKQVALAMERLGQAARLIADIRIGADRLVEVLISMENPRQSGKSSKLIIKAESSMRQHLQDLRVLGKQLEESGVLSEYVRSRGDSWGSHMPLVCPDGAVVAYAWKRQLAGQAGASAVDRTRLALKAFTDQKKHFFPHLEDQFSDQSTGALSGVLKKQRVSQALIATHDSSLGQCESLSDLLSSFEKETPNMQIFTYQRLDWFKRASSLAILNAVDSPKEQQSHGKSQMGSLGSISMDQVAILELVVPFVFRAIVALHPAGSINPDSMSFFSPDEGGNYVHSRGNSIYNAYKHIKEHADKALQFFHNVKSDASLSLLLNWICSYQTLFSKSCSKCGRVMVIDKSLGLLLPPVCRPYHQFSTLEHYSSQTAPSMKEQSVEYNAAYHIGCYTETQR